ncbi:Reticulon [Popillia japonica]|uniref:Reticulon-like protein n=2 Tax=Popillia japonica TaxID=7064 RepID=A0AAW1L974_POPJA
MTSNEQVMSTAKNLVNDTINGATTKLNQMSSKNSSESQNDECGVDKRFLLCLLFDPHAWFIPEKLNPRVSKLAALRWLTANWIRPGISILTPARSNCRSNCCHCNSFFCHRPFLASDPIQIRTVMNLFEIRREQLADLIYWRDPKKSGPVFGGVLIVLLALTYFSLISVVAYLSLLALTGTISFRIYKNVVQAVQKTGDGHPFKELLDTDFSLPQEKVEEISKIGVAHFNAAIVELRRLFLVEDLVDSIKFGVLLWCLTYLGAWFNGMTLIIIAWVALFTLPKVYETNKTQIDANLDIVRNKLEEITSKVKAAIPIGKKVEEKKQQ